jgi:hypothetical protein
MMKGNEMMLTDHGSHGDSDHVGSQSPKLEFPLAARMSNSMPISRASRFVTSVSG